MTGNIRWGILGSGDVAEKKGGPALYQTPGSELVAVMRRDKNKAEDFARRHGARRAYHNVADLLADPEIDAIYVATPPHLHCEQTLACARAGKHVLVEKPMALNGTECDRMIAACRDAGVFLHVAYYRRFYPKFVRARQLLDEGAIGQVLGARLLLCAWSGAAGWRTNPALSGGGHFVDVGSHRLDLLLHLLGDATEVSGFAANLVGHHAAENDVALSLRFASGVVASGAFHFQTQPPRDVLEIYGTAGTLALDPFDGDTLMLRHDPNRHGDNVAERRFCYPNPSPTHGPLVEALLRVYHGSPEPHVSGEEGAKTTRIMDAVLEAALIVPDSHPAAG